MNVRVVSLRPMPSATTSISALRVFPLLVMSARPRYARVSGAIFGKSDLRSDTTGPSSLASLVGRQGRKPADSSVRCQSRWTIEGVFRTFDSLRTISPASRYLIDGVVTAVGLLYGGYFVIRVVADLDGFLSRTNAEDFLVGPALTIALIPLLLGAAWLSRREQRNLRTRFDGRLDVPA